MDPPRIPSLIPTTHPPHLVDACAHATPVITTCRRQLNESQTDALTARGEAEAAKEAAADLRKKCLSWHRTGDSPQLASNRRFTSDGIEPEICLLIGDS